MKNFALLFAVPFVLIACSGETRDVPQAPEDSVPQGAAETADAPASPSFDCAKAEGEAQEMVCSSVELAAMDRELARLYSLALKGSYMTPERKNELQAMQRGWVKGRDECWKADDKPQCVMTSYALRIHELRQGYAGARTEDDKGVSVGPLALACDGQDFGVSVTFVNTDPGAVALQWKENSIALAHVQSGSGARYEGTWNGERSMLFTHGDEAMLTLPGEQERTCRVEEIG